MQGDDISDYQKKLENALKKEKQRERDIKEARASLRAAKTKRVVNGNVRFSKRLECKERAAESNAKSAVKSKAKSVVKTSVKTRPKRKGKLVYAVKDDPSDDNELGELCELMQLECMSPSNRTRRLDNRNSNKTLNW